MSLDKRKEEYLNNPCRKVARSNDVLFHYTNQYIALEKILYEDCFKFSELEKTNDPREYKDFNFLYLSSHESKEIAFDEMSKIKTSLNHFLKRKSKFSSFCSDEKINFNFHGYEDGWDYNFSYTKSRMWSQYGNNHMGVCLLCSKTKLLEYLEKNYPDKKIYHNLMTYNFLNSTKIHAVDFDKFLKLKDSHYYFQFIKENQNSIYFTKNPDYATEDEYRFVVLSDDPIEVPISYILTGLIVGDKFPDAYCKTIKSIAENHNIPIGQVDWENGSPNLIDYN
ncbi:MAG: DUF2971 domain-containing protein [Spirochaetia bacterium]|nr:DUF2971 domain-containing protein [Spirochaetia bacterium]